ncbi:efflux RND transporter permease subunit [Pseudomonas aeruginosa]|uniref:efflux RND transporter permease subunit n=1 Tax=Pseudomonas aeruginosa TaxID=287 RepID=UPI000EAD72E6|nr:efflux RND transporter permease subunit [Pseudomonas aeruginosa]EIU1681226.1 efflux RND transporter permease subunit [Pseudomonas aeruginosa]TEC54364.1 efflux RND transporter permease subunit [Pseudomonas aeruginosa]
MTSGVSAWAIRRPIPTLVLFCVLTLAGIVAFGQLPVNANPSVAFPLVNVTIVQTGATPSEMESSITRRIEDSLAGLPGVRHIQSTIRSAVSETNIEFQLGTDPDRAANDVRALIGQIRGSLPQTILEPVIQRVDVEGGAILSYIVTSSTRSVLELSRYIDDTISREILAIRGVQRMARFGGAERELRIQIDPAMLTQYELSIEEFNAQLRSTHTETPGGYLEDAGQRLMIRVPARQTSLESLREMPIALAQGNWLPLGELAEVRDDSSEAQGFAHFNGEPTVGFSVWRTKGASDIQVADRIFQRLTSLRTSYPDINIREVSSTVDYTRASFRTAMQTLIEGAFLTVLVVLLFLRDWRATLISAIALPLSIIPVFLVMLGLDFTLNSITMLALTLVIGVVVDDAIVEIENIDRHIHMGERPYRAALQAADAIALAVLATTLTIVAVFAPVSFIGGVVGQYFRQFGFTAAMAVLASLMVARLLIPLLAAYFLRPARTTIRTSKPSHGRLLQVYLQLLAWALRYRGPTLVMVCVPFMLSLLLMAKLPSGFLPVNDNSLALLRVEFPTGSALVETQSIARRVTEILRAHKDVKHVLTNADGLNEAVFTIVLKPAKERRLSRKEFELDVQPVLAKLPGLRFQFLAEGGGREVSVMLSSQDPLALARTAHRLASEMRGMPRLTNVQPSLAPPRPELVVRPRFADAARLGVNTDSIGNALRIATTGEIDAQSAQYLLADRLLPMRVRLGDSVRSDLDVLRGLRLPTLSGEGSVPLAAVADIEYAEGESRIERYDRQRSVTLDANLASGSLGEALDEILALPTFGALPAGVQRINHGDSEYMEEMFDSFAVAMGAGILAMFAILILLFRDFLQPLTILCTLPLSLIGAIPALWLIGAAIDLPAIIGMLMLMGIVTKNAILLVDFTRNSMLSGLDRQSALMAAGAARARPIMMTTVAMVAGMLPAAIGFGADSGFRIPMAVAVIGGLATSTLLSLVCVPVGFSCLDDLHHWLKPRLAKLTTITPADLKETQ